MTPALHATPATLVFLPGMMCDERLFAAQITALMDQFVTKTADFGSAGTIEDMARAALALCEGPIIPVGLSMGGIVAMEIAVQAPERIQKLAVIDTNARAEKPHVAARRDPQIAAARAGDLARVMRDELKPNYLADTPNRNAILDLCMDMAMDLGAEVFERQSNALRSRPDYLDQLGQITVPTMVLYGQYDRLCPAKNHQDIAAAVPNSTLIEIPNAGHLPTLETPDTVTDHLKRFVMQENAHVPSR